MPDDEGPLPVELPLFPLPNVVLFPGAVVPLHIFEERYRAMVRDCLDGSGTFGMVLSAEDVDAPEAITVPGSPPIHAVGAAGRIVAHQGLPDGRSLVLVEGLQRFRIAEVWLEEPYLTARVAYLRARALPPGEDRRWHAKLASAFTRYLESCYGDTEKALTRVRGAGGASAAADVIASCIDLLPARRQALLEMLDPAARCAAVLRELQGAGAEQVLAGATRRGWPPPTFSAN